jgi:hypothetical protein
VDYISNCSTPRNVLDELSDIENEYRPNNIKVGDWFKLTYKRAVDTINEYPEPRKQVAIRTIRWLIHNSSPASKLKWKPSDGWDSENIVCTAASIRPGTHKHELTRADLTKPAFIINACAGLVIFDPESRTIRLTHHTVREYFDSYPIESTSFAHAELVKTCCAFLSLDIFSDGNNLEKGSDSQAASINLDFYAHACRGLGHYAQLADQEAVKPTIANFLKQRQNIVTFIKEITPAISIDKYDTHYPMFHAAAFIGYTPIVQELLDNGADELNKTLDGLTLLSVASKQGHENIVSLFLQKGASPNAHDVSPLLSASQNGHKGVVSLLLSHGADVNFTNSEGDTPLLVATHAGHKRIVDLLLDEKASISHANNHGITPLLCASCPGQEKLVALLL